MCSCNNINVNILLLYAYSYSCTKGVKYSLVGVELFI